MGFLDDIDVTVTKTHVRGLESKANRLLKTKKTRRGKKTKNKRKIPTMSYKLYMGSAYWKKRKLLFWNKNEKACAICSKKEGVTLHHKRYDVKYGAEPDDALVALCPFHHLGFHENYQLKTNMVKDTNRYILEAKSTHVQLVNSNIDELSWVT